MSERLVSTLTVAFDGDDDDDDDASSSGGNRIVLSQASDRFDSRGRMMLEVYSRISYSLAASSGSLSRSGSGKKEIWREVLKFSNSASATLAYPTATGVRVTPGVLLRKITNDQGRSRIVPTSVSLSYNHRQVAVIAGSVRSPIPIYGFAFVEYTARYDKVSYTPGVRPIPPSEDVSFAVDTVYAYHEYDAASIDISSDVFLDTEFARVYSKIVLDPKGAWEFPPNWDELYKKNLEKVGDEREDYDDEGRFPGTAHTIDPDNSMTDERVHAIVTINLNGELKYDYPKGGRQILAPYRNSNNYRPQYHCKINDAPNDSDLSEDEAFILSLTNDHTWQKVWLKLDVNSFIASITQRYPGVRFDHIEY